MDLDPESLNSDLDLLDDEEALPVLLPRILHLDRNVQPVVRVVPLTADDDVQETAVLESDPSSLLVDVVGDVVCLETQARDGEGCRGRDGRRVGCVALDRRDVEVGGEVGCVGHKVERGELDAVESKIEIDRLERSLSIGGTYDRAKMGLTVYSTRGRGISLTIARRRGRKTWVRSPQTSLPPTSLSPVLPNLATTSASRSRRFPKLTSALSLLALSAALLSSVTRASMSLFHVAWSFMIVCAWS
jgi:hypothetical protein